VGGRGGGRGGGSEAAAGMGPLDLRRAAFAEAAISAYDTLAFPCAGFVLKATIWAHFIAKKKRSVSNGGAAPARAAW